MLSSMTHKKHGKQVMIDFNRNDEHNIQYIHFFINANIDLIQQEDHKYRTKGLSTNGYYIQYQIEQNMIKYDYLLYQVLKFEN